MPKIVPAILESTKEGFLEKLSLVMKIPGVERVQVDFGDGIFIPGKLLSPEDMDVLNPAIHWEAHLMCQKPGDFLDYQICGFKTLVIHYEAFPSVNDLRETLAEIKRMGFRNGLALSPQTPVDVLRDIEADQYLIMSVIPGKQGQSFIESTPEKIMALRKLKPNAIIEVDGGINETNIKQVCSAGADLVCAGSILVKSSDINQAYEKLLSAI